MQTIRLEHLALRPDQRILDLGCGEGRHALAAYWFGAAQHVVALDISQKDIATARHRKVDFPQPDPAKTCDIFLASGLQLPFADHIFDVVICSEVLEHIPDYSRMLQECERVLKPGGTLAVSVPRAWPERICWWLCSAYHQVEGGHIRIFDGEQLRSTIAAGPFRFIRRHWAHALHVPYWWLRCLFWQFGPDFALVRWYHRLLVWDLMQRPWLTRTLEKLLDPLMGKSLVLYFTKEGSSPDRESHLAANARVPNAPPPKSLTRNRPFS